MSGLATQYKAVNLGQGFPDFPMSEELTGLVNEAMKNNFNQYSPMPGWMPLRESIAEKVEFLYQTKINPDTEITITPGGTYAIYSAFTTILQPGDEVIVFEPAYDSYIPNIEINGAKAVTINLVYPDYHIDWAAVQKAVTPKTKAIMIAHALGNPFNLHVVMAIAKKHKLWVIEDDCDSLGATYNNKKTGTFGDIATVSFYPAHHITMGEGGAV